MNPFQVSSDNNLTRWIDAAVLLLVGVIIGVFAAQFVAFTTQTITTTKVIQRVPVKSQDSTKGTVEVPVTSDAPKVEES